MKNFECRHCGKKTYIVMVSNIPMVYHCPNCDIEYDYCTHEELDEFIEEVNNQEEEEDWGTIVANEIVKKFKAVKQNPKTFKPVESDYVYNVNEKNYILNQLKNLKRKVIAVLHNEDEDFIYWEIRFEDHKRYGIRA